MKPAYDDGQVQIYQGKCEQVLRKLGPVDHMITDPPYSKAVHKNARTNQKDAKDKKLELGFDHLDPKTRRAVSRFAGCNVRRWSLVFCDAEGLSGWINDLRAAELEHVRAGIWDKTNPMPQQSGDRPGQGFEMIEIAHPLGSKRWNGGGKRGVWTHPLAKGKGRHPTEKPVGLMIELILDFTDPGDVIVDPFSGSGALLRAAKDLGRRAIGIELNPEWVERSIDRMRQGVLFDKGTDAQLSLVRGEG